MNYYLVESPSSWFVVQTKTKRKAFSEGVAEWGRGMVQRVSEASPSDIKAFIAQKGERALLATL